MRSHLYLLGLAAGAALAITAGPASAQSQSAGPSELSGSLAASGKTSVHIAYAPVRVKAGQVGVIEAVAPAKSRCRLAIRKGSRVWTSPSARQQNPRRNSLQLSWKQGKGRAAGPWKATVRCRLKSGGTASKSVIFRVVSTGSAKAASVPVLRKPSLTRNATRNPLEGFGGAGSPPFGTLLVPGSQWFGGQGVDIISNGPGWDCPGACQRHAYGIKWQCVELVNRFIMTRGWSGRIPGNARDIYANAPSSAFDKHPAGDGYIPVPGDIMVWRGGYGHVAIVDGVGGGSVGFVEQNASASGRNSRGLGANGVPARYGAKYTFVGYLHAKANRPATVPPSVPPAPPVTPPTTPPKPAPPSSATVTGNPCSTAERAPNCAPARVSASPNNSGTKIGAFSYGQQLTARCWSTGQVITDGNNSDPSDDARTFTSDLWYGIDWNGGRGYVAATWTTKSNNKFGLPAC